MNREEKNMNFSFSRIRPIRSMSFTAPLPIRSNPVKEELPVVKSPPSKNNLNSLSSPNLLIRDFMIPLGNIGFEEDENNNSGVFYNVDLSTSPKQTIST